MKKDYGISKIFLFILLGAVSFACYLIFKPFLMEMLIAMVLTSTFFKPYQWLSVKLGGRRKIASLITCTLVVLVVIIPLVNLIVLSANQSISAYKTAKNFVNENGLIEGGDNNFLNKAESLSGISRENVKEMIMNVIGKFSNVLMNTATNFIKGTTNFLISLVIIIFAMFFFFIDGVNMLKKVMNLTPLPNKQDMQIFEKFREISYSTVLSTFITAIAQGLIAMIGFLIIGVPVFFLSILVAFFSLIPYVGSAIIWFPTGIYLLVTGFVWQGIFILIWGALIISLADNFIRAYIIKTKGSSKVHPIFIIFSILGGITMFGFWGVVIGPMIISLAYTIFEIYELEYNEVLDNEALM